MRSGSVVVWTSGWTTFRTEGIQRALIRVEGVSCRRLIPLKVWGYDNGCYTRGVNGSRAGLDLPFSSTSSASGGFGRFPPEDEVPRLYKHSGFSFGHPIVHALTRYGCS